MSKSSIEWTEDTWNPVVGCSILSPGCTNCYAMKMAARIIAMAGTSKTGLHYDKTIKDVKGKPVWTGTINLAPDHILLAPLKRKKPTIYFVNSMGDLFHEDCPGEWIDKVFAVMALSPQHTFQVLTKRAKRMRDYMTRSITTGMIGQCALDLRPDLPRRLSDWPLPNVWLGVSTERQQEADERIPLLLQTPAAIRFISAEPLLGPIDLTRIKLQGIVDPFDAFAGATWSQPPSLNGARFFSHNIERKERPKLDWVIVGGESGPGSRPMHPGWARSLRDQCSAAGVPFFFKQWGEWAPQIGAVDGWTIDDNPEISRFDHREWEDGQWSDVFRPMWCDFQDGNYDETQTVSRIGKKRAGRVLDGIEYSEMPEATR